MNYFLRESEVSESVMREILGKLAYFVDVADKFDGKLTVLPREHRERIIYIAQSDDKYGFIQERLVYVAYGPGYKRSEATISLYEHGHHGTPLSNDVMYRDKIIPSKTKLMAITKDIFK
jgi:hypothetical protein